MGDQGKDRRWLEEGLVDEEQGWKDRLQEEMRARQEEQVDCRHCQGPQGVEDQGILPYRSQGGRRPGPAEEGQVLLQEVNPVRCSARTMTVGSIPQGRCVL